MPKGPLSATSVPRRNIMTRVRVAEAAHVSSPNSVWQICVKCIENLIQDRTFTGELRATVLSSRNAASAGTAHASCGIQDSDKRNTLWLGRPLLLDNTANDSAFLLGDEYSKIITKYNKQHFLKRNICGASLPVSTEPIFVTQMQANRDCVTD